MAIKLTYFGIEGVAEKVRLALVVGGIDFEDERISFDEWGALKPTTKFGALPLMTIDGGEPVAQSGAMLRYAGLRAGLYSDDPMEVLQIEEVIGVEEDIAKVIQPSLYIGMRPHLYGYPADMPKEERSEIQMRLRAAFTAEDGELTKFLNALNGMLEGKTFFVGERVTIADCQVIVRLRHLSKGVLDGVPATILDSYPNLKAYFERFHSIPEVKAYYDRLAAK